MDEIEVETVAAIDAWEPEIVAQDAVEPLIAQDANEPEVTA